MASQRVCQARMPLHHGGSLKCYLAQGHSGMHEVTVDTNSGTLQMCWAPEYVRVAREMLPVDPYEGQIGVA